MSTRTLALAALAGAALAPAAAHAIVIDDFTDTLPVVEVFPGVFAGALQVDSVVSLDAASQAGLPSVMGGERDSTLQRFGFFGSDITVVIGDGSLAYASAFGLTGKLTLEYGAASSLNSDLSSADRFEFEMTGDLDDSMPTRPVPVTITMTSGAGTKGEATASFVQAMLADGLQSFAFSNLPGIDFSDVDSLTFVFDGSSPKLQAIDWSIGAISAVPTPGAAALLAIAGPLALRRRQR